MLASITCKSVITVDNTGSQIELPVIITDDGILDSYLRYLKKHSNKSQTWINASAHAIRLLLDYIDANDGCFEHAREMFKSFADCLYTGTIDEEGHDPSNLRWKPRSVVNADRIVYYITEYSDHLADILDNNHLQLNPFRKATKLEEKLNWAARSHRLNNSFLSHLSSRSRDEESMKQSRVHRGRASYSGQRHDLEQIYAFPESKFDPLINIGYSRPNTSPTAPDEQRLELRNVLISYLMFYGGLRISECFHIWIDDIWVNTITGQSKVNVYHPSAGTSPKFYNTSGVTDRQTTLGLHFGLKPRTHYRKSSCIYAGWKSPAVDKNGARFVHWFPPSKGIEFANYWRSYMKIQRVNPPEDDMHPFAFTNAQGSPYSMSAFRERYQVALYKIGMTMSKEFGTSPHGLRHSYGQRVTTMPLGDDISETEHRIMIQRMLAHVSPDSQEHYKRFTDEQITEMLNKVGCDPALVSK